MSVAIQQNASGRGWRETRLGELIHIKHGYAFKGEYFSNSGPFIVLTPGNFYDEGGFKDKGDKEKRYVGEVPEDFILNRGDLLVAMTEQAEGLLGSPATVPAINLYLHNQRLGLVTEIDNCQIDRKFLYYLFNTRRIRQQIRASATGTKVRHTSPSRIYEVSVLLPPIAIQRKIAEMLSAYDDLIENSTRRIKILEEMAQALYREWFVHFRFPGHEKITFINSALGTIPDGWLVKELKLLADIKGGKQLQADFIKPMGRYPVFGGNGIQGYSDEASHDNFVIAFGRVGAYCGSLHWSYRGAWINNNASSIVPYKYPELILQHLLEFDFYNLRGGSAQPFISNTALASIALLTPREPLAKRFCEHVNALRTEQWVLKNKNANLRRTRDLLLSKLVSGAVDVRNTSD